MMMKGVEATVWWWGEEGDLVEMGEARAFCPDALCNDLWDHGLLESAFEKYNSVSYGEKYTQPLFRTNQTSEQDLVITQQT